jgi:hypothetical protein
MTAESLKNIDKMSQMSYLDKFSSQNQLNQEQSFIKVDKDETNSKRC